MSNTIVRSENPRGRFQEAVLKTAAAKPGQCTKISATAVVGDVRTQSVVPGFAGENCILTEYLMAGEVGDAYAVDDGVQYYIPLPGDELMVLGLSGETLNAGTRANFNAAGKLIAAAAGVWTVQEAAGTLSADTLVLARYSGNSVATAT